MAIFPKKFVMAAVLLLVPLLSAPAIARTTIRIDKVAALDLSEGDGFDRIRIEYIVDGGRMQAVRRNMRHGDVWNVGLDITFARQLTIQIYEKEKWIKKDKKLGAFTICARSIANGDTEVIELTGHGAHYWMAIGRGNHVVPEPPPSKPKPKKPSAEPWNEGGIYPTADAASAHALELQRQGLDSKVVQNILGGWTALYRKASVDGQWIEGGIYATADAASAHSLELQRIGLESKPVQNIHGGWTALYRRPKE